MISQGVPFDELRRIKQETEDVEENRTKGLIIVEIEPFAVVAQRSRILRVEWLAEHRHEN